MALTVILGSIVTGAWLIWLAVKPWAGSMAAVSELEAHGSTYYKTTPRTDTLYVYVNDSLACMNEERIARALKLIKKGAAMDPLNPLFDCLRATAYWRVKDVDKAVAAIDASKSKGAMRLYPSSQVDPATWRWAEVELITRTSREISDEYPEDSEKLLAAAMMADAVVWSVPPDPVRVLQGLTARHAALGKLRTLGKRADNKALIAACEKLILEGNAFRKAVNHNYFKYGPLTTANRAWAMERTLKERGPRLNAANLLVMDENAHWALECRDRVMSRGLILSLLAAENRTRGQSGADK